MSWSARGTITDGEFDFVEVSNAKIAVHKVQFEAAQEAAAALVESGAIGNPAGKFNVSLSGHGNKNHEPAQGWSNDFTSIAVSQITEVTE